MARETKIQSFWPFNILFQISSLYISTNSLKHRGLDIFKMQRNDLTRLDYDARYEAEHLQNFPILTMAFC